MPVKQKNLMVGALAAVFVVVLWYMMIYSPMTSAASKAKKATTEAESKQQSLKHEIAGLKGDLPSQKGQKQQLNTAIPPTPAESSFFRDLDAIKAASGVKLQSITPTAPTGATGLTAGPTSINVNISVSGSEGQVRDYVARLEALPRLFLADSVSLTASTSSDGSGSSSGGNFRAADGPVTVQGTIAGRIFTQLVVATPGAATPAVGAAATASH